MKSALPILAVLLLASPAVAQDERVWTFSETEEGVHLQYGTPESDDVLATFSCQKGTDQAELYLTFDHRIATESPTARATGSTPRVARRPGRSISSFPARR